MLKFLRSLTAAAAAVLIILLQGLPAADALAQAADAAQAVNAAAPDSAAEQTKKVKEKNSTAVEKTNKKKETIVLSKEDKESKHLRPWTVQDSVGVRYFSVNQGCPGVVA